MKIIYGQAQLYKFLSYCNNSELEKTVLDCGAGGSCPPLGIFQEYGYKTFGIELDDGQINRAKEFERINGVDLNIQKGDMRHLPFVDNSISFVYSYNSIFHMRKHDIAISISELRRVLKFGGLCFVNFLTVNDFRCGTGENLGNNEYGQYEDDDKVIHSYFDILEGDKYLEGMDIIHKENRIVERIYEGQMIRQGFIDYIARKI
jgi:SAM-dependent methyltransferase